MSEPVRALRPPQAPSVVEGKLLGALCDLSNAGDLLDVSGLFEADLQDRRVQWGWRMVAQLVERKQVVSSATVHSRGKALGLFSDADAAWLDSLAASNTFDRDTFAQVAGDLRRGVLGRVVAEKLEQTARELRSGGFNAANVAAVLDSASDTLSRSDIRGETAASDVNELAENWDRRERTKSTPGIMSRIKLLDEATAPANGVGGFPPKLAVIMGQPGIGKNMLLAGMIRAQLEADLDLHIGGFFLEDGSRWLLRRWVALDMGIPLGNVGVSQRTEEQMARYLDLNPGYFKLLDRIHTYRYRRIRAAEMVHVSRTMIHQFGVREIILDNLTHLDHRPPAFGGRAQFFENVKRNEAVAEAVESFAELADRKEIPIIALAHTVRPASEKDDCRPPRLSEVAESSGIERVVRFAAGLWRTKSRELRLTIQKNTEGPGTDTTIELERITEAATIDPLGGRVINLEREAQDQRDDREAKKEADTEAKSEARRKKMLARRAAEKAEAAAAAPPPPAAAPAAPPPQFDLIGAATT